MNRSEFEQAARNANAKRAAEVVEARETAKPCDVEIMFAFGGASFCRTHRVMGECTFGKAVSK